MMPAYIPCANEPYCQNPVHRLGDICEQCKAKEKAQKYDEKAERRKEYERQRKHGKDTKE